MKILALETATEACSVALYIDGDSIEKYEVAPRRHAELVLPMADALIAEAGIAKAALDAIAVGRGPGAFTGVRLAIAMAQGLALALDRPVVPVSTLAALALGAAAHRRGTVLAAIDARMGELYAGAFAIDGDGLVQAIGEEILVKPDALARPEGDVVGIGSGFATYGDVLSARLAPLVAVDGEALPHASAIAKLAARAFARGEAVDAGAAQPVYLRDKVALTLEEQGKSRG